MSHDKLSYMANQIGHFFETQKHGSPVDAIADHLLKFWDPRMRRTIIAELDAGTASLDPFVRQAIEQLKNHPSAAGTPT